MDETDPTKPQQDAPGAPELGKGVKPPSAPLVSDRQVGPIFRAEPTPAVVEKPAPTPADTAEPPVPPTDEAEHTAEDAPVLDEHQARIEYLKSLRKNQPKKKKRGKAGKVIAIVLLILLLAGAGGAGAYFYLDSSRSAEKTPKASQSANNQSDQQTEEEPATTDEQTGTVETEEYTSDKFGLSVAHPVDWTPQQIGDKLTITSPVVSLTDASGQEVSGRMVFTVRPQQEKPAEFNGGNVVAVMESEKVNYTQPSPSQRGSTYISYLQYPTTGVKGGMDGIYITGDYGYQYAQNVRVTEIAQVAPLIHIAFVSCPDATCSDPTQQAQLSVSSTAWKSDTANRPVVEALLKSIILN